MKKTGCLIATLFLMLILSSFTQANSQPVVYSGMQQKIAIVGTYNNDECRTVTIMVVPKGENPLETADEDILYLNQIDINEEGQYSFAFPVYGEHGDIDIYISEFGRPGELHLLQNYTKETFVTVSFDLTEKIENYLYTLKAKLTNIFGYSDTPTNIYLGFYDHDNVLQKIEVIPNDLSNISMTVESQKDFIVPSNISYVKAFVWNTITQAPLTE